MKKIAKSVAILLFMLMIALVITPLLFKDELLEKVKSYLNTLTLAEIEFEDASIGLWKEFPNVSLNLKKLSIYQADSLANDTLLKAKNITLSMPLKVILKRDSIDITSIQVDEPDLRLNITKEGLPNYKIFKPGAKSNHEVRIGLKNYQINNGALHYIDDQAGIYLELTDVSHSGKGDFTQERFNLNTYTSINSLNLKQNGVPILQDVNGEGTGDLYINLLNNKYNFDDFKMRLNELDLTFSGHLINLSKATTLDANIVALENDFRSLLSVIPGMYTASFDQVQVNGKFDLSGMIQGDFIPTLNQYPEFDFTASVIDGSFKYPSLELPVKNLHGNIRVYNPTNNLNNTEIDLQNFQFELANRIQKMDIRLKHLFSDPLIDLQTDADLSLTDLQKAIPMEGIEELNGNVILQGTLFAQHSQLESNQWEQVDFKGNLNLDQVFYKDRNNQYSLNRGGLSWDKDLLSISSLKGKLNGSDFEVNAKIQKPLSYFIPGKKISGELSVFSNSIILPYSNSENERYPTDTTFQFNDLLKRLDMGLDIKLDTLFYGPYELNISSLQGEYKNDKLSILDSDFGIRTSDFKIDGVVENLSEYLFADGVLQGTLKINSGFLNVADLNTENDTGTKEPASIPTNLDFQVVYHTDSIQYSNLWLKNTSTSLSLQDGTAAIDGFNASVLGGEVRLSGSYRKSPLESPYFTLKYRMDEMPFQAIFENSKAFQTVAPIMRFLEGVFNTTLVMQGTLNNDLLPNLNRLTAAGFIETKDGQIRSYPPLDKLNNLINLDLVKNWAIRNTKNWFEIEDGSLILREFTQQVEDMEFRIAGSHRFNQDMHYIIKCKVPRTKLNATAFGQQANTAFDQLLSKARKTGVLGDLSAAYFLFDVEISGNIKSPDIKIIPKGIELDDQKIEDEIEQAINETIVEVKDTLEKKAEREIDSLKMKAEDKATELKDTITGVIEEKAEEIISKGKTELDSIINQNLPSETPDSLKAKIKDKVEDLFGKTSKEEVEKIQDKLKDFNPFKKKPKETTKDSTEKKN